MPTPATDPLVRSFLRNAHWAETTTKRAIWALNHWTGWLDERGLKLVDATRDDVETYLEERQVAGLAPATRQVEWRMLKALYRWLYDEGDIDANIVARVKAPRVGETPVRVLTDAEYARLTDTCIRSTTGGRRDEAIMSLLWFSGLRRSEVVALDLAAIDLGAPSVTVGSRSFSTKSRKVRTVPLAGHTVGALDRYLRHRGYEPGPLFLSQHGDSHDQRRLQPNSIQHMLRRRSELAGLGRTVGAHEFRRAMALRWRRAEGSELGLMTVAGWRSTAMIDRYTRMQREELGAEEFHRLDTSQASARRRGRRIKAVK